MTEPLACVVHASDLHLNKFPLNPIEYFSKRLLAYGAAMLHPARQFDESRLHHWLEYLEKLRPSHIVISGDLTVTGREEEFKEASKWLEKLSHLGSHLVIIPGNHDVYVERKRHKGIFPLMAHWMGQEVVDSLFETRLAYLRQGAIEWILMDQCSPQPWFNANGVFCNNMQKELKILLKAPKQTESRLIVGHYPLTASKKKSQQLVHYDLLNEALKGHSDLIYLHGHTHQHRLMDERLFGYPVSLDAGSVCEKNHPSFASLDLRKESYTAHVHLHDPLHQWQMQQRLIWSRQDERSLA